MTRSYRFAEYVFSPERQVLTLNGTTVRVGSRALAILSLLVEHPGSLVTKRDIFAKVWPGVDIGDESIRFNIAALRRVLHDDLTEQRFIVTDPGRGFRFVAPVTEETEEAPKEPATSRGAGRLPVRLTSLVGREELIEQLAQYETKRGLLTLVGPGGIGKTSVAVAVARRLADSYADGAWLVDLAPLQEPHLIPITLGSLLGVPRGVGDTLDSVLEFLASRRMLLVLDNCERLVEEIARLAARILTQAPGVRILATSREPLGAPEEHVFRLPPLATPPKNAEGLSSAVKRSYPAVRLFVERALTRRMQFDPNDGELEWIADICRHLDGNPLAIELAAAAIETVGVAGLASGLDRRFALLTRGYRTSAQRHRSLRAVMDWSYDSLPSQTRIVLGRLSVFRGAFSLEAAEEIAQCPHIGSWEVIEHLTTLTDKSLVTSAPDEYVPEFRLMETVRAYAAEKFRATGEFDSRMQRLTERCLRVFGSALDKSKVGISPGTRSAYLRQVDDLRASLDWALASESLELGVDLVLAAAPTLDSLGLFAEGHGILRIAIERLERTEPLDRHGLMRLYALVAPLSGWMSLASKEIESACRRLLELANDTGSVDFQLSALRSLFLVGLLSGQISRARDYCIQMDEIGVKAGDSYACVVARQRVAAMSTIMGEHEAAVRIFSDMGLDTHPDSPFETIRYFYEPVCTQKGFLARTLWCMGELDSALQEARGALERANRLAHVPTQFVTLIQASALIPLWTGPLEVAESTVQLCNELAGEDGSRRKYARVFCACFQIKYGDVRLGTHALKEELLGPEFDINTLAPSQAVFYAALAEGLFQLQAFDEALALVERALDQAQTSAGVWFNPELLRIKACSLAAQGASPQIIESCFDSAYATARQQRGLYWELRTAVSHAQYLGSRRQPRDAHSVLKPVYDKFTQGFELPDLRSARALLGRLAA